MSELPTNPLVPGRSKAGGDAPVAPQSRPAQAAPAGPDGPDGPGAKDQPRRSTQAAAGERRDDPNAPKVFPPASAVDVPRQPRPAAPPDPGETAAGNLPPHDQREASSWADNTEPAPHKTNVRSSIIP